MKKYYVAHNDSAIYGIGDTPEGAIADAQQWIDPEFKNDQSWLKTHSATPEVVALVKNGNPNSFTVHDGVVMTWDQFDDA